MQLRPVDGVHEYELAPLAVSVVFAPAHTDVVPLIVTVGLVLIATVNVVESLQPDGFEPTTL